MAGGGSYMTINYSQLEKLGNDWLKLAQLMRDDSPRALRAAQQAAATITGHIRREIMMTGETSETSIRTGGMARSFRDFAMATAHGLVFGSASDLIYAGVQDQGGTITAKRKFLAIPLIRMSIGKWPRHWPKGELFRPWRKGGHERAHALARKLGKGKAARLQFVYALKESVEIPAKHYIQKAAEAAIPDVAKVLVRVITEGL